MRDRRRRTFCLPWFDKDDYPAIREAFVNGERMPATYESWLAMAERVARQIEEQGGAVERLVLEPKRFTAWCRERSLPVDEQAVSGYVAEITAIRRRPRRVAGRVPLTAEKTAANDSRPRQALTPPRSRARMCPG